MLATLHATESVYMLEECSPTSLTFQRCNESKCFQVFEESAPQTVSVHPTKPHLFACPNLQSECKLFDIRVAQEKCMLKEVLRYPHDTGVRTAMMSSKRGSFLATLGEDSQLKVFDTETGEVKSVIGLGDDLYPSHFPINLEWHPRQEDMLFVGTPRCRYGNQHGVIKAFSSKGTAYTPVFPGNGNMINWLSCTIVKCHPSRNILACGDSRGWANIFETP